MKLLLSLILIILSCGLIKSQQQQFVNFVPYQSIDCDSAGAKPYGFGFSLPVGDCIVAPGNQQQPSSWSIKVEEGRNGLPIILTYEFKNYNRQCSGTPISQAYFPNGTCTPNPINFSSINGTYSGETDFPYSLVTLTSTPVYASDSIVFSSYANANGQCNLSNLQYSTTISNGLTLNYAETGNVESFYCQNGQPAAKYCLANNKDCGTMSLSATCDPRQSTGNVNSYCTN